MKLEDINKIKSVTERDIDMLLLEEFNVNSEFSSWFRSTTFSKRKASDCIGAWHSVSDSELGESDLIVLYEDEFAILIENKIDAPVQPEQGNRYIERGGRGVDEGMWGSFGTCMVAPERYLQSKKDSGVYDSILSYEALKGWFTQNVEVDRRAAYRTGLIMEAIEQNRRGYTPEINESVTDFWNGYWNFCRENYPELEMREPDRKPARSDWPMFNPTALLVHLPQSEIKHKLAEGFIDLQIPDSHNLSKEAEGIISLLGATVEQTGKSRSIRLQAASINRFDSFDSQRTKVTECLDAARSLLDLSTDLAK